VIDGDRATIRLDKWLWQARFFKTRSLAAAVVTAGKVRINSVAGAKPARAIGPGDVLTFTQGDVIRVVRLLECGTRRGPAPEARTLYDDLTPVAEKQPVNPGFDGKGRPSKRDRRNMVSHRKAGGPFPLE
jgi:ribosome-associated heat shock protein Hsp15